MKTILAIDLGKRNSVFYKLDTSSLKPEYFTVKTDHNRASQKVRKMKKKDNQNNLDTSGFIGGVSLRHR